MDAHGPCILWTAICNEFSHIENRALEAIEKEISKGKVLSFATPRCKACNKDLSGTSITAHVVSGNCAFIKCPCSPYRMTKEDFIEHSIFGRESGCFRFGSFTATETIHRFLSTLHHFTSSLTNEPCLRIIAPPQGTPSLFDPCPICMATVYERESAASTAQFSCGHSTCAGCFETLRSAAVAKGEDMQCPLCRKPHPSSCPIENRFMLNALELAPWECMRTGQPVPDVGAHRNACCSPIACAGDNSPMSSKDALKEHIFHYTADGVFDGCLWCIRGVKCDKCVPDHSPDAGPSGSHSPRGRADADEARPRSPRSPRATSS